MMNCPNNSVPTSLLGFGVINLPDGCTLTSDDYYYPHTFAGYTDLSMTFKLNEDDPEYDDSEYSYSPTSHSLLLNPDDTAYDEPLIISAVEAEADDDLGRVDHGIYVFFLGMVRLNVNHTRM